MEFAINEAGSYTSTPSLVITHDNEKKTLNKKCVWHLHSCNYSFNLFWHVSFLYSSPLSVCIRNKEEEESIPETKLSFCSSFFAVLRVQGTNKVRRADDW